MSAERGTSFQWREHRTTDGLTLRYRFYDGGDRRPAALFLHGLTRNARDFEDLAPAVAGQGRPALSLDFRGRGRSDWDPIPDRYTPATYVSDVVGLIDSLDMGPIVPVGTSLGGIVAMIAAALRPGIWSGCVLNDIGAAIDPRGVDRIVEMVGRRVAAIKTWADAIGAVKELNSAAYPDFTESDWSRLAHRLFFEKDDKPTAAYDPTIGDVVREAQGEAAPELWEAFAVLAQKPVLVVRGGLSDILSQNTLDRMLETDTVEAVVLPRVGHAPTLDEPEARAAILKFFDRLEG